ncbi:LysR family transcriptional regulator [Roseomonas hellenica]|uniref:LysR family transcriptional regulator n=2 Tax=Plastoroseomonas hellenica TaxID=2687306 RepID=A0ABS5F9G6_9PROT|nr:LysR family transcriptional regulator [Plastoroseomonas hellenica]MBR0669212.1 LysR family transcriptional regulator [Plastoroseomonas hellenica]
MPVEQLAGLTAFIRTVELGSQAAAAAALGLSRMAVGRQIQGLEHRLGVRLLQRTTRRQVLTEAGTAFFEQARAALQHLQEAAEQATAFRTSLRGSLRMSAPVSFSVRCLAPLLARFSALHPELQVELVLNDRRVDLIEEGFDLALRIGPLADSSLVSRRLTRFPVIPCAAPAYLARHGTPGEPADLLAHNCLRYAHAGRVQRWLLPDTDGQHQEVPVRGNLVSNNGDALLAAALAGQGIILQPSFIVEEALRDGRLMALFPGRAPRRIDLYALFPASRMMPTKLRRWLDFLADAYRDDAAAVAAAGGDPAIG